MLKILSVLITNFFFFNKDRNFKIDIQKDKTEIGRKHKKKIKKSALMGFEPLPQ